MSAPPLLCLVTDRKRLGNPRGTDPFATLLDLIGRASAAGVDLIQIREPDLDARFLVGLVERAVAATAGSGTRILVNDRVDVALAAGAAGVHLKATSCDPVDVRRITPPHWWVGRSVHDPTEATRVAAAGGVDYLIMGTVFETPSKPGVSAAGLDALEAVARGVRVPTLAIGGMTAERARAIARRGAAGIAAVGAFVAAYGAAGGLEDVVREIRRAFDTETPDL